MSAEQELLDLRRAVCSKKWDSAWPTLQRYLKLINEQNVRDSLVAAPGGASLLQGGIKLTENDRWALHEQVIEASLECGNLSLAQVLLQGLLRRFPESNRVQTLKGMLFEAHGNFDAAEEIYTKIAKQPSGSAIGQKRLAALERSKGHLPAAIEALRRYLHTFSTDKSAWEELADLYLELGMFRQAAFCYEELLLHAPHHCPYHIRFADTLYTLGAPHQLRAARAHYSEALVLSGGKSLRALYGISACSAASSDKEDNPELAAEAGAALQALYAAADSYKEQLVTAAVLG